MERWGALESSPEVFTSLLNALCCAPSGQDSTDDCSFEVVDLFSLDADVLPMFPRVTAVIMAFPSAEQAGAIGNDTAEAGVDRTYFLRQIEGGLNNACGTIALLHSVINSRSALHLDPACPALQFFQRTKDMSPDARGMALDGDETIAAIHNALVEQGDTAPLASEDVQHHFVAFVRACDDGEANNRDQIVELDGYYKTSPQYHPLEGQPGCDDLLSTAVGIIQTQYMQRLGDAASTFSVLLVVPKD